MNEQNHESNGFERTADDDLFWTAAQYVAGDLPDSVADEFEARLETDQAAREALAQTVALSQAVVQIESTTVMPAAVMSTASTAPQRGSAWVWIAVAASLLLAVVAYRTQTAGKNDVKEQATAPTLAEQRLALAWADNQVDDTLGEFVGEPMLADDVFAVDGEFDLELSGTATDPSAPDWLLAAVADAASTPAPGGN